MAMRFRKSINLGGGFKLNVGRRGVGLSGGVRGARFSANTSGRRMRTLSVPGTGISWQSQTTRRSRRAPIASQDSVQLELVAHETLDPSLCEEGWLGRGYMIVQGNRASFSAPPRTLVVDVRLDSANAASAIWEPGTEVRFGLAPDGRVVIWSHDSSAAAGFASHHAELFRIADAVQNGRPCSGVVLWEWRDVDTGHRRALAVLATFASDLRLRATDSDVIGGPALRGNGR